MTAATHDRRGFLRSLASLPLIGGGVALADDAPASTDPLVSLHHESLALIDAINKVPDQHEADQLLDQLKEVERRALALAPTTTAGAVAKLEWARREHVAFNLCDDEAGGDDCDLMILSALDGVLAMLRRQDEGTAAVPAKGEL